MTTSNWVVPSADVKKLIQRSIPQLMKDLEGSSYEQFDTKGNKVGWRQLLSERMSLYRPCTAPTSYVRRIHQIMGGDYQVMDAGIADAICLALGYTLEDEMETYPKTLNACVERVSIELEIAGKKLPKEKIIETARRRFARYEKKMYPGGKVLSPYQLRDREYRQKKRVAAKAA